MYTVSNDYETYVKAEARNYSLSGTIVNTNSVTMTVTRDNILEDSFSFSKQCVNNNSFGIGSCAIGSMEITLQGDYHHSLYNAEITLQQGIWVTGDSYHMQKIGTWTIKKAVWNGEWVTLTCYDKMYLTQKKYSLSGGTYTPYALFSEACTTLGITLATTQAEIEAMTNGTQTFTFNGSTQETDRKWSDVLSDMCAAICGFCTINRFGNMEVHQFGRCYKRVANTKTYYTTAVDTLTKNDRITGGAFGNGAINITGLYINDRASTNSDKSILVGSTSGTTLNLGYNRWLSSATSGYATYLQNILTQLTACQFYAADVHLADVSLYDLGDLITLQAGGEMSLASDTLMCVMNIDYNFADESTISSYTFSESSNSSTSSVESNLTNRIESLENTSGSGGNKVYTSVASPDSTLGNEGDLWVKYHNEYDDKFINSNNEEISVNIPRYESDNDAYNYVDTTIRPILRSIKDKTANKLSGIVKQFERECTVVLYQTYFSTSVPGGMISTSQFPQLVIDTYTVNNQSLSVIQGNDIVSISGTTVTSRVIGTDAYNNSKYVNVDDFNNALAEDGGDWYVEYMYLYYNTTTKYLNTITGWMDINWYYHGIPHDNLYTRVSNYSINLLDTSFAVIDEVYCKINGKWVLYEGSGEGGTNVEVTQILTSGTEIAQIDLNGDVVSIYAPTPQTISYVQTLASGTNIGTITIDGTATPIYAPSSGSTVAVTPKTSTGTNIADIEVDGTTYQLFAPSGGGGGGSGGSGYTADLLLENTDFSAASGTNHISRDYTLSASIDDYDAVIVSAFVWNRVTIREQVGTIIVNKAQYYTRAVSTSTEDYDIRWAFLINGNHPNAVRDFHFGFADNTTLKTVARRSVSGEEPKLYRVYGLKFGGGGSSGHNYSTEEQVVGTWIDGSTLYEKTIDFGALPLSTVKTVAHNIANVDKIWVYDGFVYNSTGKVFSQLNRPTNSTTYQWETYVDRTNVTMQDFAAFGNDCTAIITVRYTKTS